MNKSLFNHVFKAGVLSILGGLIYVLLETLWRGYSHWSMFILGGICFAAIGLFNEVIPWEMPFVIQMLLGSLIITTLEFITGCIVNIYLGWEVWNYSDEWLNILGQICPKYSLIWFFISAIAIILDDWLRHKMFNEDKPHYTSIFGGRPNGK